MEHMFHQLELNATVQPNDTFVNGTGIDNSTASLPPPPPPAEAVTPSAATDELPDCIDCGGNTRSVSDQSVLVRCDTQRNNDGKQHALAVIFDARPPSKSALQCLCLFCVRRDQVGVSTSRPLERKRSSSVRKGASVLIWMMQCEQCMILAFDHNFLRPCVSRHGKKL